MTLAGDENSDAPEGASDDSVQEVGPQHTVIAATPEGMLLQRLIEAADAFGDDAEDHYRETLEDAKHHSNGVLVEIARALGHCAEDDYPTRWALVHAAGQLRDEGALALLSSVVKTPIPDELSSDPHSFSSVEEETVIRTTAVDAIADLAVRGQHEEAEEALIAFLDLPSFSLRRAAVTGLKSAPRGEELRERIASCLPDDEQFLLDIQKADVRDVEQIADPTRHLSELGRAETKSAPPSFDRKGSDLKRDPGPQSRGKATYEGAGDPDQSEQDSDDDGREG